MDEMSEKKELEVNSEAPISNKPQKKKMSKKKKALIIIACILAFLLLLVVGAVIAANIYVDSMLNLISYDTGEEEASWEGVDIDAPEYNVNEGDSGGVVSNPDEFVDPESGDTVNGGTGGGGGNDFVYEQYKPDYEIIEGIFDDDIITDEDEKDVVNILLIGADTLSGNAARSDTMILMSINNVKKRIVFTSLMRDTYVAIPGYRDNRLNAAFAAGGPNLLIKTIKHNFDITVDYYFTVSIASFEMAVDVIGGVDIVVNDVNYNYFKNESELSGLTKEQAVDGTRVVHLWGARALAYARSRNFYDGDFTRTQHQRDLLTQVVSGFKTLSLEEMHSLLKAVLPYVRTNMPKENLKSMIWNVLTYVSYDVTNARVPCAGGFQFANVRGMEVLLINFNKNIEYLKAKIYA